MNDIKLINDIEQINVSKSHVCSPEQINSYINMPGSSMKIIHINIRSINCNFDHLQILLQRIQINMDIIILSECWLSKCPNVPILAGYVSHTSSHCNQNDGVVVYVRHDLKCTVETPNFVEANCLIIKYNNIFALVALYRSPSHRNTDKFMEFLDDKLTLLKNYQNIAIIGDMNINIAPDNSDPSYDQYLNTIMSHGLMAAHNLPTRNKNCLDHVFLKSKNDATTLVLDTYITDHAPVLLNCNLKIKNLSNKHSIKRIDHAACVNELTNLDLSSILLCTDSNDATKLLVNSITKVISNHTSTLVVPNRKRILKPWITPGLLRCMRNRDKLYIKFKKNPENLTIKTSYHRYKKFCNCLLKKIKKEYERNEFNRLKNNPKATWELIKNLGNINKPNYCHDLILSSTDPLSTANSINKYFSNVGRNLASKIAPLNISCQSIPKPNNTPLPSSLCSMTSPRSIVLFLVSKIRPLVDGMVFLLQ